MFAPEWVALAGGEGRDEIKREGVALAVAVLVVLVAAWLGLPERLGAHPFWALKTAGIGAAIGVAVAFALVVLRMRTAMRVAVAAVVLAVAFASAKIGAARFAASYAEDAFAGKMWFFGWIGVAAGACILIWALAGSRRV